MTTNETTVPTRWLAIGLVATTAALIAVGVWFYARERRQVQDAVERNLTAITRLKVEQIVAWRKDQVDDAACLQEHPFLSQSVASFLMEPTAGNVRNLRVHFDSLARQHDYADIVLVDTNGTALLNLAEAPVLHHMFMSVLGEALRVGRPVFLDIHIEAPGIAPHVSVVAPIYADPASRTTPLAALVLVSDVSRFLYPLLQFWPTASESAETLLVRRDGDEVLFLNDLPHLPSTA